MMATSVERTLMAAAMALIVCSPALAKVAGSDDTVGQALELCRRAEHDPARADEFLERGLKLAEQAVAADDTDARARLAVFCNLGKQIESEGIGFGTMSKVQRLRREIDTAHELAPDDPDVLAAKGAMLVQLPSMFGGDVADGAKLLRKSLSIRASNPEARRYLAVALEAQGIEDEEIANDEPVQIVKAEP